MTMLEEETDTDIDRTDLHNVLALLRSERDRLADELQRSKDDHERFRSNVRRVAMEVRSEQNWCLSGTNERLEELGLDAIVPDWNISAMVRVNFTVSDVDRYDAADSARAQIGTWLRDANFDIADMDCEEIE